MNILSDIFYQEGKTMIKDLGCQLENKEPVGSFSPSVYDTAWLAMIVKTDNGNPSMRFPVCWLYLLSTQDDNGGWPEYASDTDGILNTMAATIALRKCEEMPEIRPTSCTNDLLQSRILAAEHYLRAKLNQWDVAACVHVGFEILVPALLGLLEHSFEKFEFPERQQLMDRNHSKLQKFCPETLYGKQKTTLLHSLEAFVGKIDFDKVAQHLDEHGSMMASPAATAAYLIYCSEWDEAAEKYLENLITIGSGNGTGGVPSAFPSSIFETSWIASTFLKAGLTPEALGLEGVSKIGGFLESQLKTHGGVVGFDSGLLADVDDTAKSLVTLNLLGLPQSPRRMINEFETADHFCTYKREQNPSLSANCNALDAILHSPNPSEYSEQIYKLTRFLCKTWCAGNPQDKWNLSNQYSMMLVSQTLVKLLRVWDSYHLSSIPPDLIHDQIPLVLFQICISTLESQSSDGSWGIRIPSREVTAYAILTLREGCSLPWLAHFESRMLKSIRQGSMFLAMCHDEWDTPEHLWIEKVTYALPRLSRAFCIAALTIRAPVQWKERVTNLVTMPKENMVKLGKFFSLLPLFTNDERWRLEADVLMGSFFLPRLIRASSDVFPTRQEKSNYKYLEYIPFTWIATNRQNGYPLSNDLLWETMMIALLDYQLDEFMETIFDQDAGLQTFEAVRSIVRFYCRFPSLEYSGLKPNGHISNLHGSGHSSEISYDVYPNDASTVHLTNGNRNKHVAVLKKVETVLSRFTSHIFQHPKVTQSPAHIRRQLHQELETCMLAHIDHEQDNARFAIQRREKLDAASAHSRTSSNIIPFSSPRGTYYSWVRNTSADNTHSPFTFVYFSCLAAPARGEPFFHGTRQHYLSSALSRHLANLCRQYNDFGSVARDRLEGNLNSLNFPEFHEQNDLWMKERVAGDELRDEKAMKQDLFAIAEYERECLDHVSSKLGAELRNSKRGEVKWRALQTFISTVDLYGQIYVARDITNRVK